MSNRKKIFTLAGAHLDTTWLWDLETTISQFLPSTLKDNFSLFEKFPDYHFGFEGSYRYEMAEEYYPEDFKKLCEYVKQGKWTPLGSAYENGDVNQPSPEALFRNILYGNDYFEKKFGKPSNDIYLPDCFGFGYALPSVMAHAGLKGFSTGKLAWGSAYGIPFDLGKWYGVDGRFVYANINPGPYSRNLFSVRKNRTIVPKLKENIEKYDLPITAAFYGNGDRGGAPSAKSVKKVLGEMMKNSQKDTDVLSSTSVELFEYMDKELTEEQKNKLPTWNNELLMTNHGAGSYTSRAVGSRWNKNCERLADAAERSLVAANYLCGYKYPQEVMDTAWKRVIAHHFHDDITGTSFQKCYKRNWNDYILSQNQFAEEYRAANEAISEELDMSFVKGRAVVVNNPTQYERCEAVTADVNISGYAKVLDSKGEEAPSHAGAGKVSFLAKVPPFGVCVYDVQESGVPCTASTGLSVTERTLENKHLKVVLDENGDICEIFSKKLGVNVISGKIALSVFDYKGSKPWPAWELTYKELMKAPREYARNPQFEIAENSPVKGVIKVTRTAGKSRFVQYLSLDCESETLKVFNEVDWRSTASLLKVQFPLKPTNSIASYDLGLGYIKRGNNTEKQYEVPAQIWADITDTSEKYGVSVFSDSRTGWDKPNDNALRLTVVHTPAYAYRWETSQHLMDLGINRFSFGVFCHSGKVGSDTQTAAQCFNQPMNCFVSNPHGGKVKDGYSFARVSDNSVIVRAIKKAQNSDEIIVRFNEGEGAAKKSVIFEMGDGIESDFETLANEKHVAEAAVKDGKLIFDIDAFAPKTFAVKLKGKKEEKTSREKRISLPFNFSLISENHSGAGNNFLTIPREIMPQTVTCGGIGFDIGKEKENVLLCRKQVLSVPENCKKIYILACSLKNDKEAKFSFGENKTKIKISDYQQAVGAWDLIGLKETGYIKKDVLAWNSTHAHLNGEDVPAKQLYVFRYELPVMGTELTLPDDEDICIFAVTAVYEDNAFVSANELYDSLEKREFDYEISKHNLKMASPALFERILDKFIDRNKVVVLSPPQVNTKLQIGDIYGTLRSIDIFSAIRELLK